MWKRRFLDEGYAVNGILDRHYFQSIYIKDPDGQIVELATLGPGWTIDEEAARIGEEHRDPPAEMINTNRDRARIAAENWPQAVPADRAGNADPGPAPRYGHRHEHPGNGGVRRRSAGHAPGEAHEQLR